MTRQPPQRVEDPVATELGKFTNVDASPVPQDFLAWLDWVDQLPQSKALRERSYQLLRAGPGDRVLDVGCGTGRSVAELGARGVNSLGVDASEHMVRAARDRFPLASFTVGRAERLDLPDASLRGYRAERLFQHLQDPVPALREAHRVLETHGGIVVVDQDYDAWMLDADDLVRTRVIARALADSIAGRWIGRRLRALLVDAGFQGVTVEVHTVIHTEHAAVVPALRAFARTAVAAGAVTQPEADGWLDGLARRGADGTFMLALPFVLASATKA